MQGTFLMYDIDFITDKSAWTPQDIQNDTSWKYFLTNDDIFEINNALDVCKAEITSLKDISQNNFPLNNFKLKLQEIAGYLENDRGIFILKGLPVKNIQKMSCV